MTMKAAAADKHMHALAELGFKFFQHRPARAGDGYRGAGLMQRPGDGGADAAGGPGHQCGFAGEIEHGAYPWLMAETAAAMSSGVPTWKAVAWGEFLRDNPVSTRPEPIS